VIAIISGGITSYLRQARPYHRAKWYEVLTGVLTVLGGAGAWIGFPAGTISLIIWAVLTISGS
jgi:hypothetical protein